LEKPTIIIIVKKPTIIIIEKNPTIIIIGKTIAHQYKHMPIMPSFQQRIIMTEAFTDVH